MTMKLVSLIVENFKRIKYVAITPTGWVVKVVGRNAQGKTSIMDSIRFLLEGTAGMPDDARHEGAKKGNIQADLGKFKAIRTITAKGTTLTIIDDKGEIQGAQKFLDDLLGQHTTNAMSFLQKKPAEQRKMLADLVGADTTMLDAQIKKAYDDRTMIGRDEVRLKGQLAGLSFTDGLPECETAAAAIVTQLDEVRNHNLGIQDARKAKESTSEMIASITSEMVALQEKRARLERQIEEIDMQLLGETAQDETALVKQLSEIDKTNEAVRQNREYLRVKAEHGKAYKSYLEKSAFIEQKEEEKTALIKNAIFPVPGLNLGDDEPFYLGRPLSEASGAQKAIVAMSILAKIIPADGIRAIRIDDGEKIDSENMKLIEEIAEREKVQVWISRVQDEPGKSGNEIFIENGEVKA
jgi:hypothetical protein